MATSDGPLSVSNVTMQLTRGGSPASGGGGGEITGLTVTPLDGSIAHGNRVRIEAEASYAIGAKDQAAPRHWDMGSEVFINGVQKTQNSAGNPPSQEIWESYNTEGSRVVADGMRHARLDRQYRGIGKGNLLWSMGFGGSVDPYPFPVYHKFFARYWVKPGSNYFRSRIFPTQSITGTFQTGPNRTRVQGEMVDIVKGAFTDEAYILHVTAAGAITLDFAGLIADTADMEGATITGRVSGAEATITPGITVFDTGGTGSTKHMRVWSKNDRTNGPSTSFTYSNVNNGSISLNTYDLNDVRTDYGQDGIGYIASEPGIWHSVEVTVDLDPNNPFAQLRIDNEVKFEHTTFTPESESVTDLRLANIGLDLPGVNPFTAEDAGTGADFGEVYSDSDTRVLWLCDSSTYAASTVEPQRPDVWTENPDGSVVIDAYLNQGALAGVAGMYLAMTDKGQVIFEGVQI